MTLDFLSDVLRFGTHLVMNAESQGMTLGRWLNKNRRTSRAPNHQALCGSRGQHPPKKVSFETAMYLPRENTSDSATATSSGTSCYKESALVFTPKAEDSWWRVSIGTALL